MFLEGPLGTTLRLPTETSKHKSMGGKCDLKSFPLIQFPWRELGFQGSPWRVGAGPQHLFLKQQQSRGSLLLIVLVKMISVASGCASTGWDGEESDLSATLLSPKVYGTGDKLGFCIFPLSLGCSLISVSQPVPGPSPAKPCGP